jgi:hypothetical protein
VRHLTYPNFVDRHILSNTNRITEKYYPTRHVYRDLLDEQRECRHSQKFGLLLDNCLWAAKSNALQHEMVLRAIKNAVAK